MKQMNKEELIEFFIEQLGDNKILGKIISIEQIRNKLDYIISDVTYKEDKQTYADASWNPEPNGKGILNFDFNRIKTFEDYKKIIVHELLHALSSKITLLKKGTNHKGIEFEEAHVKAGLQISKNACYYSDGTIKFEKQNFAVNEGMTDILAEMITGIQSDAYSREKYIYKIASIIVGEDNMLKEYLSENIQEEKSSLDIFKEDIIEKYGEVLGNDINEDLKKVLQLSDQLLNLEINSYIVSGSPMTNLKFQEEVKKELYDTLENIICELIEWEEPDIIAKADDILILLTSLNEKISAKILRLFFENEIMGTEEKQSMAHSILKKYFETCKQANKKDWRIISDLYKETGNITLHNWNKKPILTDILEQDRPETIDEMNDKISQVKYRQIGSYYMMLCDNKYRNSTQRADLNEKIFNQDGMELEENKLWSSLDRQIDTEVLKRVNKRIFEIKFGISQEQDIEDLMEQLREKGKELKTKVLSNKQDKEDKDYTAISSVGNLLKIQYSPHLENNDNRYYYEFYSLNSNGILERIELRRRKKIYR